MTLCITGDIHADILNRFSFSKNPSLRELGTDDVMVCLGDVGVAFDLGGRDKDRCKYELKFMSEKPWTFLLVRGNHDNKDVWDASPKCEGHGSVRLIDGDLRQLEYEGEVYDNILIVPSCAILDVCGKRCLVVSGAESHDTKLILDPQDPDFNLKKKALKKKFYRIVGVSWWEGEEIDISATDDLIAAHLDEHFDYVFTHDAPAEIMDMVNLPNYTKTEGQEFLSEVEKAISFDSWFHGHFHLEDVPWKDNIGCMYHSIIREKDE